MSTTSSPPSSPVGTAPDFHTITCVAWSASGRNVGLGTPDGFILYSTEAILEAGIARGAPATPSPPPPPSSSSLPSPQPASSAVSGLPSSLGKERGDEASAVAPTPPPPPMRSASPHTARSEHPKLQQEQPSRRASAQPQLQEVCRRAIPGGVGLLSLWGQSSVVAVAGVTDRASASTVRLVDASRPLHPYAAPDKDGREAPANSLWNPFAMKEESEDDGATGPRNAQQQQRQQHNLGNRYLPPAVVFPGAAATRVLPVDARDLRPFVLAEATFPTTVASLHFSPYYVIVALTGDPLIPGSHQLYVFDERLQQKLAYSPYPCRSNRALQDCVSLASVWASASGAGLSIRRFRALLPSPQKGAVRLLTLRHVSRIASPASPSTGGSDAAPLAVDKEEKAFYVGDRVVHKAALRAVAVAQDGRHGVTIGEKGTNIKLVELINDTSIVEKMTLERGKTQALVESTSLHIIGVPPVTAAARRGDAGGASLSASTAYLVVCITSSGTLHLFLCDTATSTIVYSREKTLCPPPSMGFPYAFEAMFPQPMLSRGRCGLAVLQWCDESHAASYRAHQSQDSLRNAVTGEAAALRRQTHSGRHGSAATAGAFTSARSANTDARVVMFDVDFGFGTPVRPAHALLYGPTEPSHRGGSLPYHPTQPEPPSFSPGSMPARSASMAHVAKSATPGQLRCRPVHACYFPLEN